MQAGAISGAYLGINSIPARLVDSLENDHKGRDYIADLASRLCDDCLQYRSR